jgi:SHS2 domain-containing protein
MTSYTYLEGGPTADLYIEATGGTLEEAFTNIAYAMFNVITPLEGISEKEKYIIEATGKDLESLLFNLMDEFLYINDIEFLVPKRIELKINLERLHAIAECYGERFSAKTHEVGIAVKAVTFHLMEIKEQKNGWIVRMVFDT